MNRKNRILSMFLLVCILIQMIPYNMFGSIEVNAAADVISLNVGEGNIFITETGYIQTTATNTNGLSEIPWTGDYDIWGVNTKQYKVDIKSGNPNVTLHDLNSNGYFICESPNELIDMQIKKHVTFKRYGIRLNNYCNLNIMGGGKKSETDILYLDYESSGAYIGCDNSYSNGGSIHVTDLNISTNTTTDGVQGFFGTSGYISANIAEVLFDRVNIDANIEILSFVTTDTATKKVTFQDFDLSAKGTTIGICRNYCPDTTDVYLKNCNIKMNQMGSIVYYGKSVTVDDSFINTGKINSLSHSYFQYIYGDVKVNNSFINLYNTSTSNNTGATLVQDAVAESSAVNISNSTLLSNLTGKSSIDIIEVKPNTENVVITNSSIYGPDTSYISPTNFVNKYGEKLYPFSIKIGNIPFQKCDVLVAPDYEENASSLYTDENGILHLYLTTGAKTINITTEDGTKKSVTANVEEDYDKNVKAVAETSNLKTLTLEPYKSQNLQYSLDNNQWYDVSTDENCRFHIPLSNEVGQIYLKIEDKQYKGMILSDGFISLKNPFITNQSSNLELTKGKTTALFVNATPSLQTNMLTYEWYKDGLKIIDENQNTLSITNASESDFGNYKCRVIESNGLFIDSNVISVTEEKIIEDNSELNSANTTINELNKQLSESKAANQKLVDDNNSLKNQVNILKKQVSDLQIINDEKPSNNEEQMIASLNAKVIELESQLKTKTGELSKKDEFIKQLNEKLVNNSTNNSTNNNNSDIPTGTITGSDLVLKKPQNITDIISNPTNSANSTLNAQDGWELSSGLEDDTWTNRLDLSDPVTTGIFTFFYNNKEGDSNNFVINKHSIDSSNFKHIFYARRKIETSVIYLCSYVTNTEDSNQIKTSLICNNKKVTLNYKESNSYDVPVTGNLEFKVNADFGKNDRGGIYYQVVYKDKDFDPDGEWKEVKNNKIILSNIKNASRMYIKYVDSIGNFVVDKTVGFKPKDHNINNAELPNSNIDKQANPFDIPVFEMNKTIYKGYKFNLYLLNVVKDMKVTFRSSNTNIAKVSEEGIITSCNKGKAKIYGTISNKNQIYKFVIHITVVDGKGKRTLNLKPFYSFVDVNNPVLYTYKLLYKGKHTKLSFCNLKQDSKITYFNSNKNVVSITSNGDVKGLNKGNSIVKIEVKQGNKTYLYIVNVRVTDGTTDLSMWDYLLTQTN